VSIWQRLGNWRGLALAATLVVEALFFWLSPQAPGPAYEARIESVDGALVLTAVLEGDMLRIARLSGGVAEGRSQELWLIAGEAAPISLGLVPDAEAAALAVPEDLRALFAGGVLAITDEPPGRVARGHSDGCGSGPGIDQRRIANFSPKNSAQEKFSKNFWPGLKLWRRGLRGFWHGRAEGVRLS